MNALLAGAMVFIVLIVFLLLWKSVDWFDHIINNSK